MVELPTATVVGLKLHVVSAGSPEQLKFVILPVNPERAAVVIATVCDDPCVTVTCGDVEREKSDTEMKMLPAA